MSTYKTIEDTVGNTPLVRLKRMPGTTSNTILVSTNHNHNRCFFNDFLSESCI